MILRRFWLALAAAALLVAPTAFAQQGFTIEQVMSAPFPTDLTAASKGGRTVWVQDDRGVRNLWVAEAPDYRGRQDHTLCRGRWPGLGDLSFTPGGDGVVYVRGGAPNRAGEIPNPTSDAAGAEQAVWIVPVAGGEPRLLGPGGGPAVSPKGDWVAFLRRGLVMAVPLAEGGKAVELFKARGTEGLLRWSSDGARLAFTSRRGDHGFIGVYDLSAKTVQDLDPSVDRDMAPVWSPDGRSIAFRPDTGQQEPRCRSSPSARASRPRSASSISPRVPRGSRWRAEPGPGSVFHGVVMENALLWTAGNRLVFPWSAPGGCTCTPCPWPVGPPSEPTPGDFEVEHVTLAPGGREIVYSSNRAISTGGISGGWAWRAARRRR